MRTAALEYDAQHNAMIGALETGVKRPKVVIGATKICSSFVSDKYDQPKGLRRSGFKTYLQHPKKKGETS